MNISLVTFLLLLSVDQAYCRKSSRSRGRTSARFTKRLSRLGSVDRTTLFRSTILGLGAGYVSFTAGKHIINHPSNAMRFEGRKFFWDSSFYDEDEPLSTVCVNKLDPNDPQLGKLQFPDGSRPAEIAYGCLASEVCCGFDCCQETSFFTSLFSLLILILVFSVLGIFFIEAFRWGLHCFYACKHGHQREFVPLSI